MKSTVLTATVLAMLLAGCASRPQPLESDTDKSMVAAQANTQLGIEYMRENNYDLALSRLQKAIDEQPDYSVAHDVIAILYARVGNNELAEKHYRRGLQLNPDNADGHNNYGQFLCTQGRFDEAEKEFMVAASNPYYKTPQLPLLNAGVCMSGKPDRAAAEKYFRLALNKDLKFAPALYQMAELSFADKDYLKARAWLQRLDDASGQTAQSLWLAVRTEYALGDHQAWGNYALQLRSRFPDSDQARMLQEWENERRSGN
jgi:type IV pilus assembly protein PilF